MGSCELCGNDGNFNCVLVENVAFNVCNSCSKYGKILRVSDTIIKTKRNIFKKTEPEYNVLTEYSQIIKNKREKLGLSQKDFANKLNEKENLIAKIERGELKPNLDLARKIGKFLKIELTESENATDFSVNKSKNEGLTIGDFVKKK